VEYTNLKSGSIEEYVNRIEGIRTLGAQSEIQPVAALAAKLVVELTGGLNDLSSVAITAKMQLVQRMDLLTGELATLRASLKQASDDAGAQTKALVSWTRVLVVVTGVYTLLTGGLLWATIAVRP